MKMIQIQLPALYILHQLQAHGYEAYIVGGAVRDLIRANELSSSTAQYFDYDFTTNATPEQIQALFAESFYENTFGTVSVAFSHLQDQFSIPYTPPAPSSHTTGENHSRIIDLAQATKIHDSLVEALPESEIKPDSYLPVYEITTFRSESNYSDHRRPEQVTWGSSLNEDLSRRDFTCNAMALEISQDDLSHLIKNNSTEWLVPITTYKLHDPYTGQVDLENKLLKTVGNAHERFAEDALRMLRAIRFAVQLEVELDTETTQAITEQYTDLAHVSWERIQTEFLKMLSSSNPARAINLLDQTNLLQTVLPELLEAKGVEQAGHHTTDVWTHSIDALANCPSPDPIVRLATLLHDIGKPSTFTQQNGTITFYNHDIIGSRIAKKIAQRLRLSKKDIDRIFILVRYHMFHYQEHNTDASIRRFMRKVGLAHIDDILDLREGDRLGSGARKTSWRLEEMKQRMIEQLHQPMEVKDLAISGHDLMDTLKMQPGPQIGSVLNQLFEEVLDNADLNSKEYLLQRAQEILNIQN